MRAGTNLALRVVCSRRRAWHACCSSRETVGNATIGARLARLLLFTCARRQPASQRLARTLLFAHRAVCIRRSSWPIFCSSRAKARITPTIRPASWHVFCLHTRRASLMPTPRAEVWHDFCSYARAHTHVIFHTASLAREKSNSRAIFVKGVPQNILFLSDFAALSPQINFDFAPFWPKTLKWR